MLSSNSTTLLTSRPRSNPASAPQYNGLPHEDLAAQRLACRYLADACERALFDLRTSLASATTPSEVRSGLTAADLLGDVLLSWREAFAALDARQLPPHAPTFTPRSPALTTR